MTGEYTFWVYGEDDAEFWLSPDAVYTNKVLEAFTDGPTVRYDWDARPSQKSRLIALEAGKQYYFELLQKVSGYPGGFSAIGWQLPNGTMERPIPMHRAQRFAFSAVCSAGTGGCSGSWVEEQDRSYRWTFDRGPGSATYANSTLSVLEGSFLDLSPWISENYPIQFQWFESEDGVDFDPMPDRVVSGFVVPEVDLSMDGRSYFIRANRTVHNDVIDSFVITLSVLADTNMPAIEYASTLGSSSGFTIGFTEEVEEASALTIGNYTVSDGVSVTGVEMVDDTTNRVVRVTTSASVEDGQHTVTVNGVLDTAATPNGMDNVAARIVGAEGFLTRRLFGSVNGGDPILGDQVEDLLAMVHRFPHSPDLEDTVQQLEFPHELRSDYGVQFVGYLSPPVTGEYNFVIAASSQAVLYLSTDEAALNKRPIAVEPQWNTFRNFLIENWRRINNANENGDNFIRENFGEEFPTDVVVNQSKNTVGGIHLEAGKRYYIEALMKSDQGSDQLAVTWQLPGMWNMGDNEGLENKQAPIPGVFLSPAGPNMKLGVERTEQGIALSWTLEDEGYELETTTSLPDNSGNWQVVHGATDLRTNPRFIVPQPSEPSRFWRLRKE